MKYCPSCGTQNSIDSKYCRSCGKNSQSTVPVKCSACGAIQSGSVSYCLNCGQPFESPSLLPPPESLSSHVTWPSILGYSIAPTERAKSTPDSAQDSSSIAVRRLKSVVEQDRNEYVLELLLERSASALDAESAQTSLDDNGDAEHLSQRSSRSPEDIPPANESSEPVNEILSWARQPEPLSQTCAAAVNLDANRFLTARKLLRMAEASGIRINIGTFRSWQKAGLLPSKDSIKNVKYYSLDTLFRLHFIQQSLEQYHLPLEVIRLELEMLDRQNAGYPSSETYLARLGKLGTLHLPSFDPGLLYLIAQHLNINVDEIDQVIIYRKNKPQVEIKGVTDLNARMTPP